jgi:hypothetical protein
VFAIALVSAGGFGLYTVVRQREQNLEAARAAQNEKIRLEASTPPPNEGAPPADGARRTSASNPDTFAGGAASPFPFPSARTEATPPAPKARPADDASPSPTSMEEAWAQASELLEPSLQKISAETTELQQHYAPFAQTCLASPDGNWLVAMKSGRLVPPGMPFVKYGVTMDCEHGRRELVARGNAIKAELDEAERLAHSSRVLPGHWRKLMDTHQLDVWDSY